MKNAASENIKAASKKESLLLFLVFILCLSIRIAFITQKNLWFDEVFSWHISIDSFYEIIVRTSNDIHPPLYYFILKLWMFFFGDSVTALRLLSAIFASLSVFFIYPLARKVLNPSYSFIVLILYCISPLNIYYSQEVRMAAMNLFLNLGSVFFLIKLTDSGIYKDKIRKLISRADFYMFVLFTSAAIYTHYFSFFIITAEIIYIIIIYRKDYKAIKVFSVIYSFVLFFYLFWASQFIVHLKRGQSWRVPQTFLQSAGEYINYIRDFNLGLYYYYTDMDLVNIITYILLFITVAAIIGVAAGKIVRNKELLLILLLAFTPLILAGIISLRQKVEFYRYLSILVPYLLIFIVYGLSAYKRKIIIYFLVVIISAINIYGMTIHYSFKFKNDDYRELIQKLELNYKTGERVFTEPHYNGWTIDYYRKQNNLKIPNTSEVRYGWREISDSIKVQKPQSFWLVLDYSAVDTTEYPAFLYDIYTKSYRADYTDTFRLAPAKVELYRFRKLQ